MSILGIGCSPWLLLLASGAGPFRPRSTTAPMPAGACLRVVGPSITSEAPRDQELHDFVRAGIDAHDPRVAIHARDWKLLHVAVTAEQLQTAIDDLSLQVREPIFGHRRGHRIERAAEIAF